MQFRSHSSQRSIETNSSLAHRLNPTDRIDQYFFIGTIIDCFAYLHSYTIQVDQGARTTAIDMGHGLSSVTGGYRFHGMYMPGTKVLCFRVPMHPITLILGAITPEMMRGRLNMAEVLQQGSGATFLDEMVHRQIPAALPTSVVHANAHRPIDSFPGEIGYTNSLGMSFHMGLGAAWLRASEACGVFAFHRNQLLRLHGYNLEQWSAAMEMSSKIDGHELNTITRSSPFQWEMLGLPKPFQKGYKEGTGAWTQGQSDAAYEPVVPDQTGIFRLHKFEGYLGNGRRTVLSCPNPTQQDVESLSGKSVHVGLLEEIWHGDGAYSLRSAKSISFEKSLLIPVPKQMAGQDDPAGDGPLNYKSAGLTGAGDTPDLSEPSTSATDQGMRYLNLTDLHAWLFNAYGNAGFLFHKKDWYLPQESEISKLWGSSGTGTADPAFNAHLGQQHRTTIPTPVSMKIDHRGGHTHAYYRSKAGVYITDDGSIVLADAYGSEIRMGGGNVEITCQGDTSLQPGRNVNLLGGRDVILKAGQCVDISASEKDVRIKADSNLHVLAGNSGRGGLLLESRGEGMTESFSQQVGTDVVSNGVIILAKKSQILQYAERTYTRTINGGSIILDADTGKGDMVRFINTDFATVSNQTQTLYGVQANDGRTPVIETHSSSQVIFGQTAPLISNANQFLLPRGEMLVHGAVNAVGGFNQSSCRRKIGCIGASGASRVAQISQTIKTITNSLQITRSRYRQTIYRENTMVGNQAFITQVGFSCRSDDQYGYTDLKFYEANWQRAFRQTGQGKKWREKRVLAPNGTQTMPFPGVKGWSNSATFLRSDPQLWDKTRRYNADRPYTKLKLAEPVKDTLAAGYLITDA